MIHRITCLLFLAIGVPAAAPAQANESSQPGVATLLGAPTPDSLARLVLARFASGSPAAFDSVYAHAPGRELLRVVARSEAPRRGDIARVVWEEPARAVVLLAGTVISGRGGDESNRVRAFSGFYEATSDGHQWRLARMLPLDTANHILSQAIHVAITPGAGIVVVDTLAVMVGASHGLGMRLNNAARITMVELDGHAVDHVAGGGLLWVSVPASTDTAKLVLRYDLADDPVEAAPAAAAGNGAGEPAFGGRLNTDVWHPFFEYSSANDLADISITATIPAAYRLSTSVPQEEVVRDGVRTVSGRSVYPAFLLALLYDREWEQRTTRIGDLRFETFLSPAFALPHDTLAAAASQVLDVLGPRFGEPQRGSRYLAVVENRALRRASFPVRMNNIVLAGADARHLDDAVLGPSANFAHELSHGWTINASGPAANFLREGWATYAESLILRDSFGPAAEQAFWERIRAGYMAGSEGKRGILRDPENGAVHYAKGSWILHMLDGLLGEAAFDAGMRSYIRFADSRQGDYQHFIEAMSGAAGRDMAPFIVPWIAGTHIPDVDARLRGGHVVLTQSQPGPTFDLPLQLELVTASGDTVSRQVELRDRRDSIDVTSVGPVASVRIDPSHRLLLRRHWGETVRFELLAPEATSVELLGNFTTIPIAATRGGDRWLVELPMSEGRYVWLWRVDGVTVSDEVIADQIGSESAGDPPERRRAGIRVVRPVQRLDAPYPR